MSYPDFPSKYQHGGTWTDTFLTKGKFAPRAKVSDGESIATAVDDNLNCIAMWTRQQGLLCRAGRVDALTGSVIWGEEQLIGNGASPSLAMDNSGNCVHTHISNNELYYAIGKLDGARLKIAFGKLIG